MSRWPAQNHPRPRPPHPPGCGTPDWRHPMPYAPHLHQYKYARWARDAVVGQYFEQRPARSKKAIQLAGTIKTRKHSFTNLRSEEHTSELQSRGHLVCRLLLEKKK